MAAIPAHNAIAAVATLAAFAANHHAHQELGGGDHSSSSSASAANTAVLVLSPVAIWISWVASVVNIGMLASPLQLVHRFVTFQMDPIESGDLLTTDAGHKQQPSLMMVNGISIIPLLSNVACCTGWTIYSLITGLNAVLLGNGLGLVVGVIGVFAYIYVYNQQLQQVKQQFGTLSPTPAYATTAAPINNNPVIRAYHQAVAAQKQMQTQVAIASAVCVMLVWYYFERSSLALPFIRLFCGVSTIAMFAAPIAVIRKVMAGGALPSAVFTWSQTLLTLGNCVLWLLFGLMISDAAVGLPNVVGIVVSMVQMSLLLRQGDGRGGAGKVGGGAAGTVGMAKVPSMVTV